MGNLKTIDKRPGSLPKGPLRDALLEKTVLDKVLGERGAAGFSGALEVRTIKELENITGIGFQVKSPVHGLFDKLPVITAIPIPEFRGVTRLASALLGLTETALNYFKDGLKLLLFPQLASMSLIIPLGPDDPDGGLTQADGLKELFGPVVSFLEQDRERVDPEVIEMVGRFMAGTEKPTHELLYYVPFDRMFAGSLPGAFLQYLSSVVDVAIDGSDRLVSASALELHHYLLRVGSSSHFITTEDLAANMQRLMVRSSRLSEGDQTMETYWRQKNAAETLVATFIAYRATRELSEINEVAGQILDYLDSLSGKWWQRDWHNALRITFKEYFSDMKKYADFDDPLRTHLRETFKFDDEDISADIVPFRPEVVGNLPEDPKITDKFLAFRKGWKEFETRLVKMIQHLDFVGSAGVKEVEEHIEALSTFGEELSKRVAQKDTPESVMAWIRSQVAEWKKVSEELAKIREEAKLAGTLTKDMEFEISRFKHDILDRNITVIEWPEYLIRKGIWSIENVLMNLLVVFSSTTRVLGSFATMKVWKFSSLAFSQSIDLAAGSVPIDLKFAQSVDMEDVGAIFENLIENGIKYNDGSKERKHVVIKFNVKARELSFEDNGVGMSPEFVAKWGFPEEAGSGRRELRAVNADGTLVEGTGMGSVIVRRLIKELGWGLRIESTVDVGTKFIITIPEKDLVTGRP